MSKETVKLIEILLIEDNPGDVELTKEALNDARILNRINVVEDGEEALDYIYQKGKYENTTRPDLIILDLNLPKKDGREVLELIKEDENLKTIPVVVLTTSDDEKDIWTSYNLHANSYLTKPIDFDNFITMIKSFADFWLGVVKLPPNNLNK